MNYSMTVNQIAQVCHEANKAYCQIFGDLSPLEWERAPHWQRESAIAGVQLAIASELSPAQLHAAWVAKKMAEGWVFGPTKDGEKRQHPCLVPYDQLPVEQRRKDALFLAIVQALGGPHG